MKSKNKFGFVVLVLVLALGILFLRLCCAGYRNRRTGSARTGKNGSSRSID